VAEYAEAIQEDFADHQVLLEAHRTRAFLYASQRKWQRAADEYARASELAPQEPYFWWYRALLSQALADESDYRQICAAMFERFAATEDPRTAHAVVSACTLAPDALPDMSRLLPIAQVAARWYPGASRMLAAAQCRAGQYEQAVLTFQDAAVHYRLRADDWLLLALAHHHLGNAAQARRSFDTAIEWIRQADREHLDDPASTRPDWGDWHEPIWVPILRREVETLLHPFFTPNSLPASAPARLRRVKDGG
jgi:tetratricopeptide (TPR) repeat protein